MTGLIDHPIVTEKAMDDMDFDNKLQFVVRSDATKTEIAGEIAEQYDVEVVSVNTQVRPDGTKKAVVELHEDSDAQDVASRIGVF